MPGKSPSQEKTVQYGQESVSAPATRRDRKRAEIIAVAKQLFFEEGYAGTSMAEIAARVGGSKATLYNHFRSKEELLLAMVREMIDVTAINMISVAAIPDFRSRLEMLAQLAVEKITRPEAIAMQRLAAAESHRFPEVGRIFYEEGVRHAHEQMAPLFKQAMDDGVLRQADPRQAVEDFLELCSGWLARRMIWNIAEAPTQAQIAAKAKTAVAVFLDGYAAR